MPGYRVKPQVWGEAQHVIPYMGLHLFYPQYPQPLLLLRNHYHTYILLESIKGLLYNPQCSLVPSLPTWEVAMDMIKVSANSRTSAVAGAIAGVIREHKRAEVQAIGAGAVNQAVKALVLATSYLKNDGIDVVCVPEFVDVEIEDKVRTAIKLVIEPRPSAS
jgi:stage V sporulation protein S